jgi:D-arabinitol dehydrogenase (NADP+)
VNQDKVFKIKDHLSFDEASFTEPTACAIHGMDKIDVQMGDNILMFGAGPTGLILAQLLKHGGAGNIIVAAPSKFKLDLVEKLNIGTPILFDRNDESVHEKKIKSMFPKGFDIIIDATGAASVTQSCFKYAKKGSKIVIYGVCDEKDRISVSPYDVFYNEYKIIGSFAQTHCYDRAINALETGIVKVDSFISHKFSLDEYEKGLQMVMTGKQSHKVIINP